MSNPLIIKGRRYGLNEAVKGHKVLSKKDLTPVPAAYKPKEDFSLMNRLEDAPWYEPVSPHVMEWLCSEWL